MNYKEYLKSESWKATRLQALEFARYCCQLCGSTVELEVHHNNYERIGKELPSDLITLCHQCHSRHHMYMVKTEPKIMTLQAARQAKYRENMILIFDEAKND